MKLETYLNAMVTATVHAIDLGEYADSELYEKRLRQFRAFRDRILRINETNWRLHWEGAERRCGEIEQRRRAERKLHELEIEEKDDVIKHLRTALNEADEELEKLEGQND